MKNSRILILAGVAVVAVLVGVFAFSSGSRLQGNIQIKNVNAVLSAVQPESQTLGAGMNHVKVGSFTIAARSDVKVKELYFYKKGISALEVLESVSIESGGNVLAVMNGGQFQYAFKNLNFAIGGGNSMELELFVDTSSPIAANGDFYFNFRGMKFVDSNTGESYAKGFSKLNSPIMSISTVDCSNGGC